MHSSRIVTIAPDALTEESGYVLLGTIDGEAYVHLAPWHEPQTIVFPHGDLTDPQPEGEGMQGVVESPLPSWASEAVTLYDPTPLPFRWDEFAALHPEVASVLMPHQWAGE
jgi:hypothetical protein